MKRKIKIGITAAICLAVLIGAGVLLEGCVGKGKAPSGRVSIGEISERRCA